MLKNYLIKESKAIQNCGNFVSEEYRAGYRFALFIVDKFIEEELMGLQRRSDGLMYSHGGKRLDLEALDELREEYLNND